MMSNKTNLLPLDNSIKKPSSTNMMQPFTGGPDLIRRCSTTGASIPSTFAFVAQKHHLSLDLKKEAEEFKIKEELDNWEKTQPEENQINVKIAKQRILECYKDKRSELFLQNLGLTSVPNSVLQKLDNLIVLHLENNQLSSFIGTGLKKLTHLYLNNNQLSSFDGTELRNLTVLHLEINRLTSFDGTGLTNLGWLYLNNNQLTSFDGTGLTNLAWLYLENNQLSSFDGTGLTNLAWLYLYNNRLTSFDGTGLTNLTWLDLNNNQLTLFIGTGLTNLIILRIENNPALNQLPISLGQCRYLEDIERSGTLIAPSLISTILRNCRELRDSSSAFDLPIKVKLWKGFAGVDTNFDFINSFSKEEIATLNEWLNRLEKSNDFRTNQQELAKVVCNILKDLKNKEFKELALVQMETNNKACQDRAAMALNELFLSWNLCCPAEDLSNTQKLNLIIRAGKTLALHKAIAEQLKGRTDLAESVETYLFYEIELTKELNLLTCIQNMSYAECRKPLDEKALKSYVEENFLKEAASIPILEDLLKGSRVYTDAITAIDSKAQDSLVELGDMPEQEDEQTDEDYQNKILSWKTTAGEIKARRDGEILQLKIQYLKEKPGL